jgi:hypothetical protein
VLAAGDPQIREAYAKQLKGVWQRFATKWAIWY